jgi:bacterial/archaeal transporter family-2 protein
VTGRGAAVALAALAGAFGALQAPVNARLGREIGTLQAATVSFVVGLAFLLAVVAFSGGGFGAFGRSGRAPWWAYAGGLLGAGYVAIAIVTVRTLGAAGVTAAIIAGQLAAAVLIDRFGIAGVARHGIDAQRITGVALLIAGVVLVVRR